VLAHRESGFARVDVLRMNLKPIDLSAAHPAVLGHYSFTVSPATMAQRTRSVTSTKCLTWK